MLLSGAAVYDPPEIAAAAGVTTTVTLTGAALGDIVTGVSFSLDLQGLRDRIGECRGHGERFVLQWNGGGD